MEGPIGVGKTTLSRLIARRLGAHTVMEDVQNPFLEDFYSGKKGSAFQCQLFFLLNRYQQQRELGQRSLFDSKVVTDYIPPKDKIFAHLTLDDSELIIYQKLYSLLMENLPRPEVVIYLQANTQTLKKRIRSRNRQYEKQIADRYIDELAKAYNYFFFHYHDTPLLIVNTNEVDFERNASELDHLLTQLNRLESGVLLYAPLGSS
ncbi:MAG: deoxynucleoside kinase [Acidobacteriota bacterium]